MHLEASDTTFIDALIPFNAGRNDRLDRIDRLRVLAGEVHGANEERGGGVVQGAGVQLAAGERVERGLRCVMGRGVLRPSAV